MHLEALRQRIATVSDLLCTLNLIVWDSRTMMPPGGADARGSQIATLTRLARDILASDETLDLLGKAEEEAGALPPSDLQHEALRQIRTAVETHRRSVRGGGAPRRGAGESQCSLDRGPGHRQFRPVRAVA